MDFQIIFIAALIIVYGLFVYIKKNLVPKIKGTLGEKKVSRTLKRLNKKEFKVLNDILLANGNSTTQIDHIVISRSGIFVIETKNYKGWIHGHEKSEYWTQSFYKEKRKFRNPIKQNWSHVYFLKNILSNFKQVRYHPIIVFAGKAKLKNIYSQTPVVYKNKLIKTIKEKKTIYLTFEQVNEIANHLRNFIITEKRIKKEHNKYVLRNIYEKEKKIKSLTCPYCGGKLEVKKGKYGKFYGCSNFPKCKFTKEYSRKSFFYN